MSDPTPHQVERAVAHATELIHNLQQLCIRFEPAEIMAALTLQLAREIEAAAPTEQKIRIAAALLGDRTRATALDIRRSRGLSVH